MELKNIPINKVHPNPMQPREHFDRGKIQELASSIKSIGLINPINVRPKGNMYEIISGERRWKANQVAGKKEIPSIIKEINDGQMALESLIENVHREDLSDTEKAKSLRVIADKEEIKTNAELSRKVGISEKGIRMIFDSADIREELVGPTKDISQSVISETVGLSKEDRMKVIEKATEDGLGGRKVREMVSIIKKAPEPIKKIILETDVDPERLEPVFELDEDKQMEAVRIISEDHLNEIGAREVVERIKRGEKPITMTRINPTEDGHEKWASDTTEYIHYLMSKLDLYSTFSPKIETEELSDLNKNLNMLVKRINEILGV